MRLLVLPTVALIFFHLTFSGNALSDELADRAAIKSNVAALFHEKRYSELEALGAKYRASQSRTSSGLWHLTLYYAGLTIAFDFRRKDQGFWLYTERSVKKWIADYPDSATAHLAYARMLMNRGWSIRGGGYAQTVRPQDWKPFNDYAQKARAYLEKYKKVASGDPYWYELMALIGKLQSWPETEFSELISEGLRREPVFYQIYFKAIDYYAPKWGGNAKAIERFSRKALEITRSGEGYGMYARIYWYASQTQYGNRLFTQSLVHWPTMKKGIDDVLKKYPDSWNTNNFAKFACLSKDKEKTAELMARIGTSPLPYVWRSGSFYQRCRNWAFSVRF